MGKRYLIDTRIEKQNHFFIKTKMLSCYFLITRTVLGLKPCQGLLYSPFFKPKKPATA